MNFKIKVYKIKNNYSKKQNIKKKNFTKRKT